MIRLLLCILLIAASAGAEELTLPIEPPGIQILSTPEIFDNCDRLPPVPVASNTVPPFLPGADWTLYFERDTVEHVDLYNRTITARFMSDDPGWFWADYHQTVVETYDSATAQYTLVSWTPSWTYNGENLPMLWHLQSAPPREVYGYPFGTVTSIDYVSPGVSRLTWDIVNKGTYIDYPVIARQALPMLISKTVIGSTLAVTIPGAQTEQLWPGVLYFQFTDPAGVAEPISRAYKITPTNTYTRLPQ